MLVALAIITLLFYFLAEIIKFPMSYFVVYSGNSYRYYNYYEIFFTYHYNQVLPRLSGLFWEPGVYQIYLNWALFLYIYNYNRQPIQRIRKRKQKGAFGASK